MFLPVRPIAVQLKTLEGMRCVGSPSEWSCSEAESFQGVQVDLLLCCCGADWLRSHIISGTEDTNLLPVPRGHQLHSCQGSQNYVSHILFRAQLVLPILRKMASSLGKLTPWMNYNHFSSAVVSAPWYCWHGPSPHPDARIRAQKMFYWFVSLWRLTHTLLPTQIHFKFLGAYAVKTIQLLKYCRCHLMELYIDLLWFSSFWQKSEVFLFLPR